MKTISLNGPWRMRKAGAARFYDVTVPTTVCTDLLANGLLEDPYYRDNEDAALLALRSDYEYSRTFTVPEDFLDADSVELVCHGIDTIADIHLNGALLFRADNMHRTWRTGVKAALHPGENAIRVCFHSAAEYAERLERENPVYKTSDTVDGFEQVRKAHCMYGWDWGPKLPDMGIFRSIELRAASVARFADVGVRQTHGENAVDIAVETELAGVCCVLRRRAGSGVSCGCAAALVAQRLRRTSALRAACGALRHGRRCAGYARPEHRPAHAYRQNRS